jgi:hypothetical protein
VLISEYPTTAKGITDTGGHRIHCKGANCRSWTTEQAKNRLFEELGMFYVQTYISPGLKANARPYFERQLYMPVVKCRQGGLPCLPLPTNARRWSAAHPPPPVGRFLTKDEASAAIARFGQIGSSQTRSNSRHGSPMSYAPAQPTFASRGEPYRSPYPPLQAPVARIPPYEIPGYVPAQFGPFGTQSHAGPSQLEMDSDLFVAQVADMRDIRTSTASHSGNSKAQTPQRRRPS